MKKGDFVKISYSGWSDGQLIETTELSVAKAQDAYDEKRPYEPVVIIVGEGHVLQGIDKALEGMKVGDKKKLDIQPLDAFGERSFKLIKLVPLREFRKQNLNPMPGMVLEVEGRPARIQSVSGGRVRMDFNHPLAGKDVQYEIKVDSDAKTETEKLEFLLERAFKEKGIKFTVSGSGEKKAIVVDVPDKIKAQNLYQVMKIIFKTEAERYLGIKEVSYKGEKSPEETIKEKLAEKAAKEPVKKPAAKK
jgi:FKBP-type peptidyl-prolyl cis-trans isomerase 2